MKDGQLSLPIHRNATMVGVTQYKAFPTTIRKIDDAHRTITFAASTEDVDRYGDVIRVDGWKLDNFKKNPVFLWAHRSEDPPIGRIVETTIDNASKALVQAAQFATKDVYPFADTIYKLYKGGFMNAVSVGFIPLEYRPRIVKDEETEEEYQAGYEFLEHEQLELSAVPIPANPEALGKVLKAAKRNGRYDFRKLGNEFLLMAVQKGVLASEEADRVEKFFSFGETNPPWAYSVPGVTLSQDGDEMDNGKNAPRSVRKDGEDYGDVQERLKALEGKHEALSQEHEKTKAMCKEYADKHDSLAIQHNSLNEAHEGLKKDHQELQDAHKSLKAAHEGLKADVKALKAKVDDMDSDDGETTNSNPSGSAGEVTEDNPSGSEGEVVDANPSGSEGEVVDANPTGSAGEAAAKPGVTKTVIPFKSEKLAPKDEPWDAGKEQAKAQTPKARKRMSTVIVGDPDNLTSYKLPHHKGDGFATVWRGVANALSRLEQTDMPSGDRDGARSHLTKHKKEFGKDDSEASLQAFETRLINLGKLYRQAKDAGLVDQAERLDSELRAFVFQSFEIEDGGTSSGNAGKSAPANSDGKSENGKVTTVEGLFAVLVKPDQK